MSRDPDCVFCAVVPGETEAEVVFSDDDCVAFLDHRPLFPGHVLLVPREHHVTIEDLPADQLAGQVGGGDETFDADPRGHAEIVEQGHELFGGQVPGRAGGEG